MLPLLAVWIALGACVTTCVTVVAGWQGQEAVVTLLPYTYAVSVTLAAAVLWGRRGRPADEPGAAGQTQQALAAIVLSAIALAVLLIAVNGLHGGLAGLAVEAVFLWACWLGYRRFVLREG